MFFRTSVLLGVCFDILYAVWHANCVLPLQLPLPLRLSLPLWPLPLYWALGSARFQFNAQIHKLAKGSPKKHSETMMKKKKTTTRPSGSRRSNSMNDWGGETTAKRGDDDVLSYKRSERERGNFC